MSRLRFELGDKYLLVHFSFVGEGLGRANVLGGGGRAGKRPETLDFNDSKK